MAKKQAKIGLRGIAWEIGVAWDNKTPNSVTTARLLNSPAIAVYEELKGLATDVDAYLWRDDKIEEALLQRNDPLVTLGLAQYGASDKVAAVLYKRGCATNGDVNFNKALRLGVLGNSLVHRRSFSKHTFGVVPDEDVLGFINTEEGTDELHAIVTNAGAKKFLDKALQRGKAIRQHSGREVPARCLLVPPESCDQRR
jgi:hypothetical protein